jgi:hypothetical protein
VQAKNSARSSRFQVLAAFPHSALEHGIERPAAYGTSSVLLSCLVLNVEEILMSRQGYPLLKQYEAVIGVTMKCTEAAPAGG